MKIYISGLYSGTNPQPGIGIARSLREAYPDATLIGVEYSNRCSGIHWHDFDDIWLHRTWQELDLESHGREIKKILDAGALWISANDLEVIWLADVFPDGHPNLLTPPSAALEKVAKPAILAHHRLPVKIPTFVTTELSDWELHAFCREHNWKVWLKGPYYEAVRTRSWAEFQDMRHILSTAWSTEKLFLQAHVTGYEESISLSAYNGKLLDCVRMRKRDLTDLSKTWAGDVSEVPEEILEPLRETIKELNWSGGAELEMVRDADEQLWLLEINPRYPAWIHGATITGRNVPGRLVEGATGVPLKPSRSNGQEFTRVVLEIPVRNGYPLPSLPEPFSGGIGHSLKHPSGLLGFANRLHAQRSDDNNDTANGAAQKTNGDRTSVKHGNGNSSTSSRNHDNGGNGYASNSIRLSGSNGNGSAPPAKVPASFIHDISNLNFDDIQTPSFLFLEKTAANGFQHAQDWARKFSSSSIKFTNAYSIKTNPDTRLVALAKSAGFCAEAISLLEVKKALEVGFSASQIILNGPGKWWRKEHLPSETLHAVFCDSIADLKRVAASMKSGELKTSVCGVRLRTPNMPSRFGIPMESPKDFKILIESIGMLPAETTFGVHFHMASSHVGVKQWWHIFESILRWCSSIETLSRRKIEVLDLGGGWFPDDWHADSDDRFARAMIRVQELLPHVKEIISEPGKALAQPSMALAMRILEIQDFPGITTDVVVDGSIAELPMSFFYPHRILHQNSDTLAWNSVGRGKAQLLGRLCMENDIVASNVGLPSDAKPGDLIVFCDAGAYDRSMSYVFGRG